MIAALDLPTPLPLPGVTLRRAREDDLAALVALIAGDEIAVSRGDTVEDSELHRYRAGLHEILAEPSNEVVVAVTDDDTIVGMLQVTRIPGLSRRGATRLLVETVRVGIDHRGTGLGTAMLEWATGAAATSTGSAIVQLTTHARRTDAHRFYERLGFVASHIGFKLETGV